MARVARVARVVLRAGYRVRKSAAAGPSKGGISWGFQGGRLARTQTCSIRCSSELEKMNLESLKCTIVLLYVVLHCKREVPEQDKERAAPDGTVIKHESKTLESSETSENKQTNKRSD